MELKGYFDMLEERARREATAFDLAINRFVIKNDGTVLPRAVGAQANEDFNRITNKVQSLGNKIFQRKLDGILGSINWTGNSDKIDEVIYEHNYQELAKKLATDLVVKGNTALAINSENRLYRLGGFVTEMRDLHDIDTSLGILQAFIVDKYWTVKIFHQDTVSVWENLRFIRDILKARPKVFCSQGIENIAFYSAVAEDDIGIQIGEIESLSPLLIALMATDANIERVSEMSGFPRIVIKGQVQDNSLVKHAPRNAILLSENGSVNYLESQSSLTNLLRHKQQLKQELNELAILPAGFFELGTQISGIAIANANASFNNNVRRYAALLSSLLQHSFSELFGLLGINSDEFSFTVTPNEVVDTNNQVDLILKLLNKNLLTPKLVVQKLQNIIPEITDADAIEIIDNYNRRNQSISLEDLGLNVE